MGPQSFRDGIFSASDPLSPYGTLLTTYSDGTLGSGSEQGPNDVTPKQCGALYNRWGFGLTGLGFALGLGLSYLAFGRS